MSAVQLSVNIITYNEEKNIERCINSVRGLADDILVVDSFSTDHTKEICQRLGVRFVEHPFAGYIEQQSYILTQAIHDYVLVIDADEALSEKLCQSIRAVKENWTHDAYRFNRCNNYYGYWIRHGGLYPDNKLRLWDRRRGKWGGMNPHYSVKLQAGATVKKLEGDLLHYAYPTIEQHIQQINNFTSISSRVYYEKGKRTIPFIHLYVYPTLAFLNHYFVKLGFLDGLPGLIVCKNIAYSKLIKYSKLLLLTRKESSENKDS